MITVQDRIVVEAANLGQLEMLVEERYKPAAAGRGLHWAAAHVSPPVLTDEAPLTLWIRWEVADVGAWWAMRAQAGTAEVAAFWGEVDELCLSRERTYLAATGAVLPAPLAPDTSRVTTRGHRLTAQLAVNDGALGHLEGVLAEAAPGLPGLECTAVGRNLAPEYAAGHITWDLLFRDADSAIEAQSSDTWRQRIAPVLERDCRAVHALGMETIDGGIRAPGIAGGVKRTAFFRLLPGCDARTAARFEQDLLAMPLHIPEIRNWRLSRAVSTGWHRADVAPWTYVWEQEFADIDGLTGPYMAHPHHWAHIDRWFDPESGVQVVDVDLSHAFSPFGDSLLGRELVPAGD